MRSCRTDLLSIDFPVFFARFLSHLYLSYRLWKVLGSRLLILYFYFSFFAVILF